MMLACAARGADVVETDLGRRPDLDAALAKLSEAARPAKVIFAVVTDGLENASREFTRQQVIDLIRTHQERDRWEFVFLSADLASIGDAVALGIDRASCHAFRRSGAGTASAFAHLSKGLSLYRASKRSKIGFQPNDDPEETGPEH